MTDIVPELSEAVAKQFEARARSDPRLAKIAGKIRDGTATMANAHEYAESVGEILSDVFLDLVGEGVLPNDIMYYNIAKRIVEPALRNNYDLITEAAKLIQKHVDSKEGIGIESVPAPFPDERVAGLIDKITEETNIPWIRVLYCYPDKITDELIEEFKTNPRLLKYIDLPLQHISNRMLKAMNRHGDDQTIRDVIAKLRTVEGMVIRTTFIVGFPGETEEDFNELADFITEQKFEHAGVFTYSREEGTPAYDFEDQIDEQVKQDRMDILMRTQMNINTTRNESRIGSVITVLCEAYDPVNECYYGRSSEDAPDIDGKVFFRYNGEERIMPGSMVKVKVREVVDYDVYGFAMKPENA